MNNFTIAWFAFWAGMSWWCWLCMVADDYNPRSKVYGWLFNAILLTLLTVVFVIIL